MTELSDILSTPTTEQPATPLFAPDIALAPVEWKDAASWQFEAFAMHYYEDNCRTCGSVHRHSSVYRMFIRKYPAATDRRLVLADIVPATLKVIVYKMPIREVPICHFCLTADREGAQRILVSSENEWNEAQRRDREARAVARRAPTVKVEKSLGDLL